MLEKQDGNNFDTNEHPKQHCCFLSMLNELAPAVHTGCLKNKYSLLAGNRNETIRYYYSPSEQVSLSVFNLDSHTLHLKIVHQTPEIQACKVKFYSAPQTRGFEKGPSYDLYHVYFLSTCKLKLSFEKNKRHVDIALIKQI